MSGVRILGIAGGSGSGKTHLAERLAAALGPEQAMLRRHDDYYRELTAEESEEAAREAFNFDHPSALDSHLLADHLGVLRGGGSVAVPRYDFARHAREGASEVGARPIVVVEGVLTLAVPEVRAALDVAVFVRTPEWVRLSRRLQRDEAERGRSRDSVLRQYFATVRPMHERFVAPSAERADLVVHGDRAVEQAVRAVRGFLGA